MADPTDVSLPITPRQIQRGVGAIVEQVHPRPRGESCAAVGEMERRLTAYAGDLVHAAYRDHASVARRDLADDILGSVENGPWKLITDPALRQTVGEYVADTCHTIALAADLPEVAEQIDNSLTTRLATVGTLIGGDARDRLARHLHAHDLSAGQHNTEFWRYERRADRILAVITGKEN